MSINIFPWQGDAWERLLAEKGRLPQALLFTGRAGTGKLAFARAFAEALLCEAPQAKAACGRCASCGWYAQGAHPDFKLVEPAAAEKDEEGGEGEERRRRAEIRIAQVREITDFLTLSSHRAGAKVVLLHPAEALNAAAGNALLKSLEEPPAGSLFLLVSHRPRRVLPTILSRCRRLPLPAPDREAAARWLAAQGVSDPALALADAGDSPLAALALADPKYREARRAFLNALRDPARLEPVALADACRDAEPAQAVAWMQKWCHDLVGLRQAGRLRYNPDFEPALRELAAAASEPGLLALERLLASAQRIAQHPLNPRLFLESLLLYYARLLTPRAEAPSG